MIKPTVLLIDDEPDLLELVRAGLEREGLAILGAFTGEAGLREAEQRMPDLILLDLMLPDVHGFEVCRRLRANRVTRLTPIMMLTAKTGEADRVAGLELGADDYLTKPFSRPELAARVNALLRRAGCGRERREVLRAGQLVLDAGRHVVLCDGREVAVTPTEFRILHYLIGQAGRVQSREEIVAGALNHERAAIGFHIAALRRKLGPGSHIQTVPRFGYKLEA